MGEEAGAGGGRGLDEEFVVVERGFDEEDLVVRGRRSGHGWHGGGRGRGGEHVRHGWE